MCVHDECGREWACMCNRWVASLCVNSWVCNLMYVNVFGCMDVCSLIRHDLFSWEFEDISDMTGLVEL